MYDLATTKVSKLTKDQRLELKQQLLLLPVKTSASFINQVIDKEVNLHSNETKASRIAFNFVSDPDFIGIRNYILQMNDLEDLKNSENGHYILQLLDKVEKLESKCEDLGRSIDGLMKH